MSKGGLGALRRALAGPPGSHLDDEVLAEMVTAEVSGEDVEAVYATQLEHVESCVSCAETYGDLLSLMADAVEEMAAAAAAQSPADVYATVLQRELAAAGVERDDLPALAREVASTLAASFTRLPDDVSVEMARAALAQSATGDEREPELVTAVTQALQQTRSALALYLETAAGNLWGRAVAVRDEAAVRWRRLYLSLEPPRGAALLRAETVGDRWPLFQREVGDPRPLTVEAHAERVGPLACRIVVRVDRPGLRRAAGRAVEIAYRDIRQRRETDENGVARFEPIPIAALPELAVHVEA